MSSNSSSVANRALLVSLSIKQWSGRKYDAKASRKTNAENNVIGDVARVNKLLLPTATSLDVVHRLSARIRTEVDANTLPWSLRGVSLLPTSNYFHLVQTFGRLKDSWQQAVEEFLSEYATLCAHAPQALGGLYNADDYPPEHQMRNRFDISLDVMPVPTDDFRVSLADAEVQALRKQVLRQSDAAVAQAVRNGWGRLHYAISNMVAKLADPEAIFRDTLTGNVQELATLLPRLNVLNDPELDAVCHACREELDVAPQTLRDDPLVRAQTLAVARSVVARIDKQLAE